MIQTPARYIWFYGHSYRSPYKEYRKFSNFYPSPFNISDRTYSTVEHYFQSKKFEGTLYEDEIIQATTPALAKRMGRSRMYPLREDWENIKDELMLEAIRAKINYHQDIKELLLSTDDKIICEHTKNDSYWEIMKIRHGLRRVPLERIN